jgi:hypothetical protein
LCSPVPADAGATFKVGSFTKSTTVTPPDTTQTVAHGLGETPKAIIFWVSADTGGAFTHDQASSNTSRRQAAKLLTIVQWSEGLLAEAGLASWDAHSFTLVEHGRAGRVESTARRAAPHLRLRRVLRYITDRWRTTSTSSQPPL